MSYIARYDFSMTKIAISLPNDLVVAARAAVDAGRAASVSAYVAAALVRQGQEERLSDLLADLDAEFGPLSDDDWAFADRALAHGQA